MWPQSSAQEQQLEQCNFVVFRRIPLLEAHTLHLLRRDVPAAEPVDGGGGGSIMSEGPKQPRASAKAALRHDSAPAMGENGASTFLDTARACAYARAVRT